MMTGRPDPSRIRIANERDARDIIEICRAYHNEVGRGEFSAVRLQGLMSRAFNPRESNETAIIAIAGQERVEGSICVVEQRPILCDVPFLHVAWCFVMPEHRRSLHQQDMIAWAKALAKPAPDGLGLDVRFELPAGRRTEAQSRLMTRALGDPMGHAWTCTAERMR